MLGATWVLFVWSVLGQVLRLVLLIAGVDDPARSRVVAVTVTAVGAVLLVWGYAEAMRIPRVKNIDVTIDRLGRGLDGLRVAVITDAHYGPIDRARWSAGVVARVNALGADVVCRVGDIADGPADVGDASEPAGLGERELGPRVCHRRPRVLQRGAGLAGLHGEHRLDRSAQPAPHRRDRTGTGWSSPGRRCDREGVGFERTRREPGGRSRGGRPRTAGPSPCASTQAGCTRGARGHRPSSLGSHPCGQIWPFNFLVRFEQPVVNGLSRHGDRTQLYTSRGTGFWGPPFRVFAPSEITLLTLRRG